MIYFLITALLSPSVDLVRGHNINPASSALRRLIDSTPDPRLDISPCLSPESVKFNPKHGELRGQGLVEGWSYGFDYRGHPYNVTDQFETTFVQNATARVRRYSAGEQKIEADLPLNFGETLQLYMHAVSPRDPVQLTECSWESVTEYFEKGGAGLRIDVENTSSFTVKDLNNTWTRTSGPNYNGTRSYAIVVGYTSTVVLSLPQANVIGADFIQDDLRPGDVNFPGPNGSDGSWCIASSNKEHVKETEGNGRNEIVAYVSMAGFPDYDDCFGFMGVYINTEGGFGSTPEPTPSPTSASPTSAPTPASTAPSKQISVIGLLATLLAVAAAFW